jgi:hypothetical protein
MTKLEQLYNVMVHWIYLNERVQLRLQMPVVLVLVNEIEEKGLNMVKRIPS